MENDPRKNAILARFRVFGPPLGAGAHNTIGLSNVSFSQKSSKFQNFSRRTQNRFLFRPSWILFPWLYHGTLPPQLRLTRHNQHRHISRSQPRVRSQLRQGGGYQHWPTKGDPTGSKKREGKAGGREQKHFERVRQKGADRKEPTERSRQKEVDRKKLTERS